MKALETSKSLHRSPVGERGGGSFTGTFERNMERPQNGATIINMGSFLNPDYVKNLSLGAMWNFCEGPGIP
jgi:hypothetical protein